MTSEVQAFEAPKPALRQERAFYGCSVYECVHIFNLSVLKPPFDKTLDQPTSLFDVYGLHDELLQLLRGVQSECLSSQNLPQKSEPYIAFRGKCCLDLIHIQEIR